MAIENRYIVGCNGCPENFTSESTAKKESIDEARENDWFSTNYGEFCLCPACREKFGREQHLDWTNNIIIEQVEWEMK